MKQLGITILLTVFLSVTGCSWLSNPQVQSYALDMAKLTAFVNMLVDQYDEVEAVIEKVKPQMTPDQQMTVDVAKIKFRDLIKKLEGISKLQNYQVSTYEISYMWNTVISERDRIKEDVVIPNKDKFGTAELFLLRMFNDQIDETDRTVQQMIANPTHDNVSNALNLISTGLMFGVKVLGMSAAVL